MICFLSEFKFVRGRVPRFFPHFSLEELKITLEDFEFPVKVTVVSENGKTYY